MSRVSQRDIYSKGINSFNINQFTFDKGVGGTLTLGGQNNKSGVLKIKDSLARTTVQGDSTGLTVYNTNGNAIVVENASGIQVNGGNITIYDSNGIKKWDALGLISTQNFTSGQYTSSAAQSTSSLTFVDIPGYTLTFTVSRTVNILFSSTLAAVSVYTTNPPKTPSLVIEYNLDGSYVGPAMVVAKMESGVASDAVTLSSSFIRSVSAGTHTIKLQWDVDAATSIGTILAGSANNLQYIVLGN